jgi:hypothetical protein
MQTHIDLPWGDGIYTFRLPLPQIAELQAKTKTGIGTLYAKLLNGRYLRKGLEGVENFGNPSQADYSFEDVYHTVKQALIGGKAGIVDGQPVEVSPQRAVELMGLYAYPARPMQELWDTAVAILTVTCEGWDDGSSEETKKKEQEQSGPETSSTSTAAETTGGLTTDEPLECSRSPDTASKTAGE